MTRIGSAKQSLSASKTSRHKSRLGMSTNSSSVFNLFSLNPMAVKRLMSMRVDYRSDSDVKWLDNATKLILKALSKANLLSDLENALTRKSSDSKCVLLLSNTELQVVPSDPPLPGTCLVAICKIWRWNDLKTHFELQPSPVCSSPLHDHAEYVCVNPYHYERICTPTLPSVLVPRNPVVDLNCSSSAMSLDDPSVFNFDSSMQSMSLPGFSNLMDSHSDVFERNTPPPLYNQLNDSLPAYSFASFPVSYVEPAFWCSVSYYELNQRVGAVFHASQSSLTVDGFTDPSCPDRFCLGSLSNINRNPESEDCRLRIGHGVRLYYIGGEVYAECLSANPIFAQSPSCNFRYGWHPATVCKIPPGCNLKIFENQAFANLLSQTVSQGFEGVYQLTRMCTIRMSFVKGWGSEYKRQTITSTPCWIEIHLNGPLQWLDRVIAQLQPPGTLSTN